MNSTEPHAASQRDREPLLAITLCSSNAPIPIPTLADERLRGFALFKSRRREDGRERFRLHLGYFQTMSEAERVLVLVRPTWPRALVAAVPDADLGSLDNTALTRFSIVQPPAAAEPAPEPPPTVTAKVVVLPVRSAPPVPTVAPPVLHPAAPAPVAPAPVARPAVPAPAATKTEDPDATVLMPAPRPQVQRYAVQLAFGREPIDLARLPDLAIYEGYLLYAIEADGGGRRLYGVRLGFYDDVLSARLVAQYVRSEFRGVSIVPVSEREYTRANAARIRLQAVRASKARASSLVTWPKTALTVSFNPSSHLSLAN